MSGDAALVELLHFLRLHDYRHIAVTPATHATVLARPIDRRPSLADIFGWSRPFERQDLEPLLLSLLERAGALDAVSDGLVRCTIRVASLGNDLFIHSAFPTDQVNAVFFGPDTYRFARWVESHAPGIEAPARIVDMGGGSGAGGILAARAFEGAEILLVDINPEALRMARINAMAAGFEVELIRSDRVPVGVDLMIANPPYLMDGLARYYRDGGKLLGGAISLDWARQGLAKLRPDGTILLYTAAAYVDGRAPLLRAIEDECRECGALLSVEEIDPDIFGEQLLEPDYEEVERLAAVGIRIRLQAS